MIPHTSERRTLFKLPPRGKKLIASKRSVLPEPEAIEPIYSYESHTQKWAWRDSNPRQYRYERHVLTTELQALSLAHDRLTIIWYTTIDQLSVQKKILQNERLSG